MKSLLFGFLAFALVASACVGYDDRMPESDRTAAETSGTIGTAGRVDRMSDAEAITSEVEANLLAIPAIESDVTSGRIDVDTDGGVVTLNGEVGSEAEKENAISMAWSVAGVTGVNDSLTVEHQ